MANDDCLFCSIAEGTSDSDIVYEDDQIVAFKDINPQAPVHLLLIPREHITGLQDVNQDQRDLLGHIQVVASDLAQRFDLKQNGFRVVTNAGREGGQAVGHLHYHLLGGRQMNWPPG